MKKRFLKLLLALTMICTSLVGCGGNSSSDNQTSNENSGNYNRPTDDEISDAFEQVKEQENKDKYSDSEYTKVSIYPYKPKRENEIDHLVQDLSGEYINWVNCWDEITVDFYIPNELFGEVTYNEDRTNAKIIITKEFDNPDHLYNGEIMKYELSIDIYREGYSESGVESNAMDSITDFYNRNIYDKTDKMEIEDELVIANGSAKLIYSDVEDAYSNGSREQRQVFVAMKYIRLSPKCTARMELKVFDREETEVSEYYTLLREPEVLYEVLDAIEIELNTNTEIKLETESDLKEETVTFSDDTVIEFKNSESYKEFDTNKDGIVTYAETKKKDGIEWKEDSFENLKYFTNSLSLYLCEDNANKYENLNGIEVANTINFVEITSSSLKDISAISNLSNLWHLYIEAESLQDISPISQLINLEQLEIRKAYIKDLKSLSTLKNLKGLAIRSDSLESLDGIENLESVDSIYIISNKITEEDVKAVCEQLNKEYSITMGGFLIRNK